MFGKKPSLTPSAGTVPAVTAPLPAATGTHLVPAHASGKFIAAAGQAARPASKKEAIARYTDSKLETEDYNRAKLQLIEMLLERMDFKLAESLAADTRKQRIKEAAEACLSEISIPLNAAQLALLKEHVVDEVLGFGPLEPLLADPDVADIMVNTHKRVYIEKQGRIYLTDIRFSSEKHLLNIIQKIVSRVGRRIDETSPMVDARMPDGSRFNAIIPPLAMDGCLVSIRKFKRNKLPLTAYVEYDSMSADMAKFLEICAHIRLNIIISGGTGSGKTTLLNALSGHISPDERVVTIEDAAELQMVQPHVLRLETRTANIEGLGEISQRQLVKNALRMRPDRIILGEIRGDEVMDVLSAMNTGHDGSMVTIHANSPRDALGRIENLVGMAGSQMPLLALRQQIASAVQLIVQIARMRDGQRRIVQIEEVVGADGDVIVTQALFSYKPGPLNDQGHLTGQFMSHGIRPRFLQQAEYFGRDKELVECLKLGM